MEKKRKLSYMNEGNVLNYRKQSKKKYFFKQNKLMVVGKMVELH